METGLPHLFLKPPKPSRFTSIQQVVTKTPIPHRNRSQHSAYLKNRLRKAWEASRDESVVHHTSRNGVYLEFKGWPNIELATKSLEEMRSKKIRLLNVRTEVTETGDALENNDLRIEKTDYATVYVANEKKEHFFDRIGKYASTAVPDGKKPPNADLVNSINDIRKALLIESFWLDARDLIPKDDPEWCEVWLSSDVEEAMTRFNTLLDRLQISSRPGEIRFPERTVKVIKANRNQLEQLTRSSDDIAEYRLAKETARFWLKLANRDQKDWVNDLLTRIKVDPDATISVCLLDTGVNNGHPLLAPILKSADCQSVDPAWGSHDHDKHGTLMAGVAGYGDLQGALESMDSIRLNHVLESVKILPPTGSNDANLWGFITAQGIYKAEIQAPERHRINCIATTARDTRDRGRPSSWSAELDQLSSGARGDGIKRLIIVCAGNITANPVKYPDAQTTDSVHDPAQSWNALTVGAFTALDIIKDPTMSGYTALAPHEGLSPYTTTSCTWENQWPIKPEIVMEGGNLAIDGFGFCSECDDLSLLSTFFNPRQGHFHPFRMTSAATAQAAWFAAQIQTRYPNYWPETIRALIVHSAEWTEMMKSQFGNGLRKKGDIRHLLRVCGYGVPDLEKALYCSSNSLTLIAQNELQPYVKKKSGSIGTNEMHLYALPWPREVLLSLPPETEIKMRVTLSYFIEPGPGEIGWKDRYRYPSSLLKFDINSPGESKADFERRINAAEREDKDDKPDTESAAKHWVIGQFRDKGSIHSDIWKGSAADLAGSSYLAVFPRIGWWKERSYLKKWDRKTRYSLIVSISAPTISTDIYTLIASMLEVTVPIEVKA